MLETSRPGSGRPSEGRVTLGSLQLLRGLAAIAVAIYHTHLILASPNYGAIDVLRGVATKGWLGVNFFFVLSGFIILYAHIQDVGVPSKVRTYLWRRFSRVYPVYWIALTGYIAAAFIGIGYPDFRSTLPDLLSAYLLVPLVPEPSLPLKLAWTLLYEVGFYALFTLLILHRTMGLAVAAFWVCGIAVNSFVLGNTALGLFNIWNIYFLVGAVTLLLFRAMDTRLGPLVLALGCLSLFAMMATGLVPDRIGDANGQPLLLLALAVPFSMILLGATQVESARGWKPPRPLILLGDASYSIYLVHAAVISVVAQLNHMLLPGLIPPLLLFTVTATASVVAGVVFHLLIERPLLRAARRWPRPRVPDSALAVGRAGS